LHTVHESKSGGLGSDEGPSPTESLSGQHSHVFHRQSLPLSEHVPDLAASDSNVSSGNVRIRSDVFGELEHERLAESKHFSIRLSFGVKVGSSFSSPHWQTGQGVLEDLLKSEELDYALVHGRVESQATFVWTDSLIELASESSVDLHVTIVIHPRNSELENTLGLADGGQYFGVFRVLFEQRTQGFQHLLHGLQEFLLVRVAGFHLFVSRNDCVLFLLGHGEQKCVEE